MQTFDRYMTRLAEEKNALEALIERMEQEGRQDEANLNKVRLNIVNVFETVAGADLRAVSQGDWAAFCARYLPRFQTLSAPWRTKLEKALAHSDVQSIAVEEAKLDMLHRIKAVLDRKSVV